MRKLETPQELAAAVECAQYIFDSDCEEISFQEWMAAGNEPENHIYYQAAIILDIVDDLMLDYPNYEDQTIAATKNTTKTIDCTPTWSGILPVIVILIENPNTRKHGIIELKRMAALADAYLAEKKK